MVELFVITSALFAALFIIFRHILYVYFPAYPATGIGDPDLDLAIRNILAHEYNGYKDMKLSQLTEKLSDIQSAIVWAENNTNGLMRRYYLNALDRWNGVYTEQIAERETLYRVGRLVEAIPNPWGENYYTVKE